jgi:hypothetical protein
MREHQGSTTIDADGRLWLPYDLTRVAQLPRGLRELHEAHHAGRRAFSLDFARLEVLHIVNAMGVALGDSIIGLGVLRWLKERHPRLQLHLHRAFLAPRYVEELYTLAAPLLGKVRYLPADTPVLESSDAALVDLGDFAYWPEFARMPMVDFFFWALGIRPETVAPDAKTNRWLAGLDLPAASCREPYALFFPTASTRLRSMPQWAWRRAVDRIWNEYRVPVFGAAPVDHPHYARIALESEGMGRFLAWIRSAAAVVSVDTAAVHAAAGFDVPCLAFLNTIDPALRTSYYPRCSAVDLRVEEVSGLHRTDDEQLMTVAETAWHEATARAWPFPRRSQPVAGGLST